MMLSLKSMLILIQYTQTVIQWLRVTKVTYTTNYIDLLLRRIVVKLDPNIWVCGIKADAVHELTNDMNRIKLNLNIMG